MRIVYAAAVLAAASAMPAFAQDAASAPAFSGGHVELVGGYDRLNADGEGASGATIGIAGGYDFRNNGGAVFGIEAEASESTTDDCANFGGTICAEAGRDLYLGGRVGGVIAESVLLYAKAGYSNARVALETAGGSAGTNLDGIRGGVGLEWSTGTPLVVRAEYRYTNYESDFSRHQAVLGLGMRF
jgi:outer membrane immunogenic protein